MMKNTRLDYILRVRLPITIFVGLAAFIITFYAGKAERDGVGYQPDQPINFPHDLHAGKMNIDCKYCHTGVSDSRVAMVPPAAICMNCHTVAKKDSPEIIKLTNHYNQKKAILWERVHRVPDFAYFNHSVHVNNGIDCENCHGDVAQMKKIKQVHTFTMAACLDCHRNAHEKMPNLKNISKGPDYCFACHR